MNEKQAADIALRKAIEDHAKAYGILPEEECLLDSFAIVSAWTPVNFDDDDPRTHYASHFHAPYVPNHIAVGLFQVGVNHMSGDD